MKNMRSVRRKRRNCARLVTLQKKKEREKKGIKRNEGRIKETVYLYKN